MHILNTCLLLKLYINTTLIYKKLVIMIIINLLNKNRNSINSLELLLLLLIKYIILILLTKKFFMNLLFVQKCISDKECQYLEYCTKGECKHIGIWDPNPL